MTEAALKRMVEYDWPGNVRELENLVERLAILRRSGWIDETDLPARGRGPDARAPAGLAARRGRRLRGAGGLVRSRADPAGARGHRLEQEPRRAAAGPEAHHAGREDPRQGNRAAPIEPVRARSHRQRATRGPTPAFLARPARGTQEVPSPTDAREGPPKRPGGSRDGEGAEGQGPRGGRRLLGRVPGRGRERQTPAKSAWPSSSDASHSARTSPIPMRLPRA